MTVTEAMAEMFGLTPKQARVLAFIVRYRMKNGYSPTYREIGTHFGNWVNSIHCDLTRLARKGAVRFTHSHRSLVPCCELLLVKETA